MRAFGQYSIISGDYVYVSPVTELRIQTTLDGREYPVLERIWDNEDDAVFDSAERKRA